MNALAKTRSDILWLFFQCIVFKSAFVNTFIDVFISSHGLSYPISGLVKSYFSEDYATSHPIVVCSIYLHFYLMSIIGIDLGRSQCFGIISFAAWRTLH